MEGQILYMIIFYVFYIFCVAGWPLTPVELVFVLRNGLNKQRSISCDAFYEGFEAGDRVLGG